MMADPLSVAGGVVGLISLGIQVTKSLVGFYTSYKSQDSNIASTTEKIERLLEIFRYLQKNLSDRNFQTEEQSLIKTIEKSIQSCDELIQELQDECQKFSKISSNGIKAAFGVAGRRATYPFRQSTLKKLDEDIGEIFAILSSALDVLQLKDNDRIQDGIDEIKTLLGLVKTSLISSDLRDWLKAPDATINYNAACLKKHPGTGTWLIKSSYFTRWLTDENSFMWLNGFAGSGKSVLCSTVIQSILRHRKSESSIGIAFFYFTFNDESKQDESGMLRALLVQLSNQLPDDHADLTRLHDLYKASTPPSQVLIEYLRRLIQRFQHVYVLLDALDESSRDGSREHVLNSINTMRNWSMQGLHLFVTSRDEPDIRDSFDLSINQQVIMRNDGIDEDIANFISCRLDADRRLRKWLPYRVKIQETLARRAKGMFRWVECQFKSLQMCPRSEDHLEHLLDSLPQSLDETYERMLCNIDRSLIEDARRILTLLCFAPRPLTEQELIDGIAVRICNPSGFNHKRRLQDFNDINEICPGLIDISFDTNHKTEIHHKGESNSIVRIAHYSVQEYLKSERIRHQKAAIFNMTSVVAHFEIAQICIIYLLGDDLSNSMLDQSVLKKYPMARFAAMYWYYHFKNTIDPDFILRDLIFKLFQRQDSLTIWIKLYDIDRPWNSSVEFNRVLNGPAASVYYASLLGLHHVLHKLIDAEQQDIMKLPGLSLKPNLEISKLINSHGGYYGNALQAASRKGYDEVVQLLLNNDAHINAQGENFDNALQAASYGGREKVVQLLLERGANINTQGGFYGNALQAASIEGHEQVVQLLLNKGANINAQDEYYGNVLQAASYKGHEKVMQLLLDKGANINAQGGYYGNALQAASFEGHEKAVELLLNKGANINAHSGHYDNALRAASYEGHEKIVYLLLDNGANINAQGEYRGNALQTASYRGHEKVVQFLLDKGADVNAHGGHYGNALQAASFEGHDKVVQFLLDKGADVNAQENWCGTALQAASYGGREKVVQLLLEKGANISAQDQYNGNALQIASYKGHEKVVQSLLDKGADVNAHGGYYGNALQAASYRRHEKVVRMLLDKGADINIKDLEGRTLLHLASARGQSKMVKMLSGFALDLTIIDKQGRSCLHHAASKSSVELIGWLLKEGFDPNLADHDGWTPLHWAAKGSADAAKVLQDAGANSTIEAIKGWTPHTVAIFHHNENLSIIDTPVHEVTKWVTVQSMGDEYKVIPGIGQGVYCNGCFLHIYGPRYKCLDCPRFHYCFKCKASSDKTHVDHKFVESEEPLPIHLR